MNDADATSPKPGDAVRAGYVGILLTVAYDGTTFSGWAPQPTSRTVSGELLGAVRALCPTVREVRGASRTDAGVHARGQRAAFDTDVDIPSRGWVLGLARHLPPTIAVRAASRVKAGFVPRFAGTGKRYVYSLLCDPVRDPFHENRTWRVADVLDRRAMRAEAALALGRHDFRAFRASQDGRTDTVRSVTRLDVADDTADPRVLRVVVEGDRFLYNMVRILVGTLVDVGRGRLAAGAVGRGLASGERGALGVTAPAAGLVLDEVFLADEGEGRWPALPAAGDG